VTLNSATSNKGLRSAARAWPQTGAALTAVFLPLMLVVAQQVVGRLLAG